MSLVLRYRLRYCNEMRIKMNNGSISYKSVKKLLSHIVPKTIKRKKENEAIPVTHHGVL
jgi:hypothetical protein